MKKKKFLFFLSFLGMMSCSPSGDTLPDGDYEIIDIQTESADILNKVMKSLPSFDFSGSTLKVCNGDLAGFFADSVYTYRLEKDYLCLQSDIQNCKIAIETSYSDSVFKLWILSNGINLIHVKQK